MKPITEGSRWKHHNGIEYTVLHIANATTKLPERYPITIVYRGDNGLIWARPMTDWHRSMTFVKDHN